MHFTLVNCMVCDLCLNKTLRMLQGKEVHFPKRGRKAADTKFAMLGSKVEGAERVMGMAPGSPGKQDKDGKFTGELKASRRRGCEEADNYSQRKCSESSSSWK